MPIRPLPRFRLSRHGLDVHLFGVVRQVQSGVRAVPYWSHEGVLTTIVKPVMTDVIFPRFSLTVCPGMSRSRWEVSLGLGVRSDYQPGLGINRHWWCFPLCWPVQFLRTAEGRVYAVEYGFGFGRRIKHLGRRV